MLCKIGGSYWVFMRNTMLRFFVWQDNNWYFPFYNYYFLGWAGEERLSSGRVDDSLVTLQTLANDTTANFSFHSPPLSPFLCLWIKYQNKMLACPPQDDKAVNNLQVQGTKLKLAPPGHCPKQGFNCFCEGWINILMNGPRTWNSPFELL